MPDAAMLETMAWWAGGCGLLGLGAWAMIVIANGRTTFGSTGGWEPPPVEVPGFKPPDDDDRKWSSPRAALRLTASGAVGGALLGWFLQGPVEFDQRMQLGVELFAVAAAIFVLVRTMRDTPAVGEAPPDDPEESVAVRVRNAAFKLLGAAFMLAMVWWTVD